jgi:hypothetical protein
MVNGKKWSYHLESLTCRWLKNPIHSWKVLPQKINNNINIIVYLEWK